MSGKLALLLAGLTMLGSCKHEPGLDPEPLDVASNGGNGGQEPEPVDTCDPNIAWFEQDVQPIFIQYCTMSGCHNTATDANEEIDLTSYNAIMASDIIENGDLWEALMEEMSDDDNMPPDTMNQLDEEKKAIIQAWLAQGALNNSCEGGCNMGSITYSGTIQPIIQDRCIGCHSGNTPSGGLNFGSWAVLNEVATDGRLAGAIQHQYGYTAMPPTGPSLSQCRIDQVLAWIQDGAPQN